MLLYGAREPRGGKKSNREQPMNLIENGHLSDDDTSDHRFLLFLFFYCEGNVFISLSFFLRNKRNPNTPLGDNIKKERSDVTVKIHRPFYLRPDMIFRSHLAKGCHDAWLGICIVTPLANSIITVKRRISTTNFLGGTTGDHSKIGPTVRIKTYIFTYYC